MKRKGTKLTDEQKAFVVQRLACWDTPAEAAAALKEEHGVDLTPQGAEAYDPNKRAGRNLAKRWRELYATTRASFKKNLEEHIPEANKVVRVRHLALAAKSYRQRGNYVAMADMLERVAKELGNVHTNRREVTGKDGGPMEHKFSDMTDEQLNARLKTLLNGVNLGTDEE